MKPEQKAKLERFFDDTLLVETIRGILFLYFLKRQETDDVQILAASRLAIDRFLEGWTELEKYKRKENSVPSLEKNIGL